MIKKGTRFKYEGIAPLYLMVIGYNPVTNLYRLRTYASLHGPEITYTFRESAIHNLFVEIKDV